MQSPLNRFNIATIPESAAITTATTSSTSSRTSNFYQHWSSLDGDVTTHSPLSESIHDSVCSVYDLLIHLLQPIGLWTISCINFDRYYAICSPLHYNTLFTTKKVSLINFCGMFGWGLVGDLNKFSHVIPLKSFFKFLKALNNKSHHRMKMPFNCMWYFWLDNIHEIIPNYNLWSFNFEFHFLLLCTFMIQENTEKCFVRVNNWVNLFPRAVY